MAKRDNGGTNFIIGTIVGGVVGAATALFLSPKTGADFRRSFNDQATVVKEKTNTLSKSLTDQSNQLINKVRDMKMSKSEGIDHQPQERVEEQVHTTGSSNEQLFQQKLAEAQKAIQDAENGLNQ